MRDSPTDRWTRRSAVGAIGATAVLPSLGSAKIVSSGSGEQQALILLDQIAESLLRLGPEAATSLGIDKGSRRALKSLLSDRSVLGQRRIASVIRKDLARAEAIDTAGLSHSTRTSMEVVKSAYRLALDGFALPYVDVAVGGWRNTPYVVIQNVGAYLDVPRLLEADHSIANAADAEAYLVRLSSYARQLDGELARRRLAGAQ